MYARDLQSASVTSTYISSAVEAGQSWSRVERFLLACLEGERAGQGQKSKSLTGKGLLRGMRVQVRGRMGERVTLHTQWAVSMFQNCK